MEPSGGVSIDFQSDRFSLFYAKQYNIYVAYFMYPAFLFRPSIMILLTTYISNKITNID